MNDLGLLYKDLLFVGGWDINIDLPMCNTEATREGHRIYEHKGKRLVQPCKLVSIKTSSTVPLILQNSFTVVLRVSYIQMHYFLTQPWVLGIWDFPPLCTLLQVSSMNHARYFFYKFSV